MDTSNKIEALPTLRPGKALYAQVADAIAEYISGNALRRGDRLPSQSELMKAYGVSQATVRQALLNLSNRGLARAEHGRGVFVDEPHINISVGNLAITRRENGSASPSGFEHLNSESVFAPERVAGLLKIDLGTPIIRVRRIIRSDMRLIGLETSNLPFDVMQRLNQVDLNERVFEDALKEYEDLCVAHSTLKISAGSITEFDADLMGVSPNTTTIQKEETFISKNSRPVMMQRTVLIASNVDLTAEMYR